MVTDQSSSLIKAGAAATGEERLESSTVILLASKSIDKEAEERAHSAL